MKVSKRAGWAFRLLACGAGQLVICVDTEKRVGFLLGEKSVCSWRLIRGGCQALGGALALCFSGSLVLVRGLNRHRLSFCS